MRARLEVSITTLVEVELTREEFDEIEERAPISEDELPERVRLEQGDALDPSMMLDHVQSVEIVGVVDDSPEARKVRRDARRRREETRDLAEGERDEKKRRTR